MAKSVKLTMLTGPDTGISENENFSTQIYINWAIIHLNSNISNQLTKHPGARKQLTRVTDCETARL